MSRYFPLFVNLEERKIVVVGAGKIAERRIGTLLSFGAQITVIAPEATEKIKAWDLAGELKWQQEAWSEEKESLLENTIFVLAATDEKTVNEAVYCACKKMEIPVNCSDDRSRCDFYFPGIAERGRVIAGVTAGGTDHKLARKATEQIRKCLEEM